MEQYLDKADREPRSPNSHQWPSAFSVLPTETILKVITFLPPKTVLESVSILSNFFHSLSMDSFIWKHFSLCRSKRVNPLQNQYFFTIFPEGWLEYFKITHLMKKNSTNLIREKIKCPSENALKSRYSHTATASQDQTQLFIIGGESDESEPTTRLAEVHSISCIDATTVQIFPQLSPPDAQIPKIARHTANLWTKTSQIIIYGGYDGVSKFLHLHIFTPPSETYPNGIWSQISTCGEIPTDRSNHVSVIVDDYLYVYSGLRHEGNESENNYTIFDDFYKLDLNSLTWSKIVTKSESPGGRIGHRLVNVGTKLIMLNGGGVWDFIQAKWTTKYSDIWFYDTELNYWWKLPLAEQETEQLYPILSYSFCWIVKNWFYCAGGQSLQSVELNEKFWRIDLIGGDGVWEDFTQDVVQGDVKETLEYEALLRDMGTSTVVKNLKTNKNEVWLFGGYCSGSLPITNSLYILGLPF